MNDMIYIYTYKDKSFSYMDLHEKHGPH
jgi:hypothetical protein